MTGVMVRCLRPLGSRRAVVSLVAVALGFVTLISAPRPAVAACSCEQESVAQGLYFHEVVFTGELIGSQPGDPLIVLDFKVDLIYKGEVAYLQKLATWVKPDDCGLLEPALGKWLIVADRFPSVTGPLIVTACSASTPLIAGDPLPAELANGRYPADRPDVAPPASIVMPDLRIVGPRNYTTPALYAGGALGALGLLSRLLMGRRRVVV
jgi:hypothetical protein